MVLRLLGFAAVIGLWIVTALPAAAEDPGAYMLNRGDTVEINVWREDTLAKQLTILPDGSFSFPLIGRVEAAGRSVTDIEGEVTERLKPYISDPVVTVSVIGIDGNRIYVIGKVRQPGPMVLQKPTSVMQALSIAGGFDKFADTNSIKILRSGAEGQKLIPFNYDFVADGSDLSMNITMQAGDVIVVP